MNAPIKKPEALRQIDLIKIYSKNKCLIVDDMREVRSSYRRMLLSFGVNHIDTASNSDQVIEYCDSRDYGLIICDYNLEDSRDGQQILEELRFMGKLKYTTLFIIITAETSSEMVLGAIENQPDDYITKPISQKLMRTRLDRALLKHENLYSIKSSMDAKDYVKAIKLCDVKIKKKDRYFWDLIRYKAQIYRLMDKPAESQRLYESVLREKDFSWAKIGLARSLIKQNNFDGIETIVEEVLEKDHRYIEAHDLLSEFYEKTEQYEAAQTSAVKAAELSPRSVTRHRKLAQLAEVNGDDDVCLKAYEESVRWNYGSCHASAEDYLGLARKTVDVTKNKVDRQSIERSKKALSLLDRMDKRFSSSSNKVKSTFIESQLYTVQGKESHAVSLLNKAEKQYEALEEKDVDMRLDFARAHLTNGDKSKAHEELEVLSEEYSNDAEVLKRIDYISDEPMSAAGKASAANLSKQGVAAYQAKEYDKSIEIFTNALTLFPKHVGVNLNLVQVALDKSEADGKSKDIYSYCQECFSRVDGLDSDHKQYARYQFLVGQFQKLYQSPNDL